MYFVAVVILVCFGVQDAISSTIMKRATLSSHTTEEFNNAMLNRHNELRQKEASDNKAKYMYEMKYDAALATASQAWADKCDFVHSTSDAGENLFMSTGGNDILERPVNNWYNEINYYDWNTDNCTKVCGHYQQVVWAMSKDLGCGIKLCENLTDSDTGEFTENAYFVVCQYKEGRQLGKPYVRGTQLCEKCPNNCVSDSLCEHSFVIEECKDKVENCQDLIDSYGEEFLCKGGGYSQAGFKCDKTCKACTV